jgi:hypothetical protein
LLEAQIRRPAAVIGEQRSVVAADQDDAAHAVGQRWPARQRTLQPCRRGFTGQPAGRAAPPDEVLDGALQLQQSFAQRAVDQLARKGIALSVGVGRGPHDIGADQHEKGQAEQDDRPQEPHV